MVLILVGLVRLFGHWLLNRLLGRWFGRDRDREAESRDPSLAFYYRMVRILSTLGLERPSAETPREFARRAALALDHRDEARRGLTAVPPMIVAAFYSKRFGNREAVPRDDPRAGPAWSLLRDRGLSSADSKP